MTQMLIGAHRPALVDREKFNGGAGVSAMALEQALRASRIFGVEVKGCEYIPHFFLDKRYDTGTTELQKSQETLPCAGRHEMIFRTPQSVEGWVWCGVEMVAHVSGDLYFAGSFGYRAEFSWCDGRR